MCFPFPTFIDDIFSLWNVDKEEIYSFIELANNHHPTINLLLKFQKQKPPFWIHVFTKEKDLRRNQS